MAFLDSEAPEGCVDARTEEACWGRGVECCKAGVMTSQPAVGDSTLHDKAPLSLLPPFLISRLAPPLPSPRMFAGGKGWRTAIKLLLHTVKQKSLVESLLGLSQRKRSETVSDIDHVWCLT